MEKIQQIMHIHGGNVFENSEDYLNYLRMVDVKIDFSQTAEKRWYKHYYLFLDDKHYQVILPIMPSKFNAKYEEWKIWFERHFQFMHDDIIFVGHSLGGNFLAKYLSENVLPVSVKQLHLIAAPFHYREKNIHALGSINFYMDEFPKNFFENNIKEIHLYHSNDDTIVPISESKKYLEKLPRAHFHRFTDRGHFLNEEFPELFEIIKQTKNI